MKIVKTLGDERCYLFEDGEKVSWEDKDRLFKKKGNITNADIKIIKPDIAENKENDYGRRTKKYNRKNELS